MNITTTLVLLALAAPSIAATPEELSFKNMRAGTHTLIDAMATFGSADVWSANDPADPGSKVCYRHSAKGGDTFLVFSATGAEGMLTSIRFLSPEMRFAEEANCSTRRLDVKELETSNGLKLGTSMGEAEKLLGAPKSVDGSTVTYASCVQVRYKRGKAIAISLGNPQNNC